MGAMLSSSLWSSASSSKTPTTPAHSDSPVPGEESTVRAWLVAQGFRSAEIRREKKFHDANEKYSKSIWMHPMARGCYKGELNVCKWLYDNGAAKDITKTDSYGYTPMHWACDDGHLSVCQWLFEVDLGFTGPHGARARRRRTKSVTHTHLPGVTREKKLSCACDFFYSIAFTIMLLLFNCVCPRLVFFLNQLLIISCHRRKQ